MSRINVIIRRVQTEYILEHYDSLVEALYKDRRQKVERLKNKQAVCISITAGLLLQTTAFKVLGLAADDIAINRGANGKPYIAGHEDFCFNISHSGEYVVLAYSDEPVGVDIEQIRDKKDNVAARCFTPSELEYLKAGDECDRFCQIWTMKESYLKLSGKGISVPLNSFNIDVKNMQVEGTDSFFSTKAFDKYHISVCAADVSEVEYIFKK